MLKLIVGDEGGVLKGSSIPVRWCVTQDTMARLKEKGIQNPNLLIVTIVGHVEMTRQLVPLEGLMDYVQPQRAGLTTIAACIVWDKSGKVEDLEKRFTLLDNGKYKTDVLVGGSLRAELECSSDVCSIDVDVPQEIFAKKSRDWGFVNWLFQTPCRDQCHLRQRRLVAYWFNPIAAIIIAAVIACALVIRAAIAAFLLLSGCMDINLKPVVNWNMKIKKIWEPLKYKTRKSRLTLTWRKKDEFLWQPTHAFQFLTPLAPICWIAVYIFVWLLTPGELKIFDLKALIVTALTLFGTTLLLGVVDLLRFANFRSPTYESRQKRKAEKPLPDWLDPELLLCDAKPLTANIHTLPLKKRTLRLKFLNFKAEVCKPFQK